MGRRGGSSWAVMAADLVRTTDREDAPAWAAPESVRAATLAASMLRRDALARVASSKRRAVAEEFQVAPRVLHRWIAPGGWLHLRPKREQQPEPSAIKRVASSEIPAVVRLLEEALAASSSCFSSPWCASGHDGPAAAEGCCAEDAAEAAEQLSGASDWLTDSAGDQPYTWITRVYYASKMLSKAAALESRHRPPSAAIRRVCERSQALSDVLRGPPKWTGDLGPLARIARGARGPTALADAAEAVAVFASLGDTKSVAVLSAAAAIGSAAGGAETVLTAAARLVLESFGATFQKPVFPAV